MKINKLSPIVTTEKLALAANDILTKVDAILPASLKQTLDSTSLFAPAFAQRREEKAHLEALRRAIRDKHKVRLFYTDARDDVSERLVRPLCLAVFAPRWLLAGWCELRQDFRNFRLDRIQQLDVLPETFVDEPGKGLQDFLARVSGS